jgi:hypothetical protein
MKLKTLKSSYKILNPLTSACTNIKGVDILTYSKIECIKIEEQLIKRKCNLKHVFDYVLIKD